MSGPAFGDWVALPSGGRVAEWRRAGGERLKADPVPAGADLNAWVNRIPYTRDIGDDWQRPSETLKRRAGDCEDLAILKRAILIRRGLDPADAHLVIGLDSVLRQHHAVLLAGGEVFDCTTDRRLTPADLAGIFRPMFAYGDGAFVYGRKA